MISADYIFLRGEVDSNLPIVTQGQKLQMAELDAQWNTYKAEMEGLINKEVKSFNTLCSQKGLMKVIVP